MNRKLRILQENAESAKREVGNTIIDLSIAVDACSGEEALNAAMASLERLKSARTRLMAMGSLLEQTAAERGAKEIVEGDLINHPAHYCRNGIECIDVIEAATADLAGSEAVCTANAMKYLFRWKQKGGVQDLKKARWYLDRLITQMEDAE